MRAIPLRGPSGEPVDFLRTIASHGVAELPPNELSLEERTLVTTLPLAAGARTVRLTSAGSKLRLEVTSGRTGARMLDALTATVIRMFRLGEDLSGFYDLVRDDAELGWAGRGAGRMLRAPTVFEDVVKTICTTNTAWSGTRKMTRALVENLGVEAPGGRRTFPTPEAMAAADEQFYKAVIRAGYRGPYLKQLANDVAEGTIDLEELNDRAVPDEDAYVRLLALPGVGPYAAAHIMLTSLGRYGRLVLDSWTRPTYVKLAGGRSALKDATIERRFKRYGNWAGLAFWLYLTRDWVEEGLPV